VYALAALGDARAARTLGSVADDATGFYAPIVRRAAELALPRLIAA